MKKFILYWSIMLVFGMVGAQGHADAETPVTLKLTWFHGSQFLGFYVAQEQGYYADEGLEVTIEPRRKDDQYIMELVANGQYEFSVGGAIGPSQADGVPVIAIAAIYQFGPDTLFAKADSGIVTPADLAGRRIINKSPGWQRMLEALLQRENLTMDDITPVEGGWDMTPFFTGDVEVWAGFLNDEVIRARQQGLELVTLPLYEYGITTVAQTVATSRALLESTPDLAVRFLRGSLRGWQWAIEHPTQAVDIMLRRFPEMEAEREFHLAAFDASIPLILPPGTRLGSIDCEAWRQHHVLADVESAEELCTTKILEAVWESLQEGQ
ncbi:hypothetical protein GF339_00385 [candidate division KSB3 bacterium]|uniref:Thiamine pyrimidine synthase n=1 Tax=candidate division KSB3 bacterium TaxID=2044937 RepID=A0A9D5JSW7_9BACT|nr:hypothetical protein [candidate division KSB3 bacterium]MBD3323006.1 hypothetical protein [candidate division KSB3 bacterium]